MNRLPDHGIGRRDGKALWVSRGGDGDQEGESHRNRRAE
jgi:hypothetical protein